MSSTATRHETMYTEALEAETGEVPIANSPREEQIRCRAYEIYLERGEQPGCDLDDWLRAECELQRAEPRRDQAV
jgi:Protein of unknown function (DUF2934)